VKTVYDCTISYLTITMYFNYVVRKRSPREKQRHPNKKKHTEEAEFAAGTTEKAFSKTKGKTETD